MTTAKILLGSTQTLRSYPAIDAGSGEIVRGQPSSVTVRIGTPAVAMPAEGAGVAATVDTLSTELTGDALEGSTQLFVEEATFAKGRQYLLTTPTGASAPIVGRTQGASDTLDLANEIPFDAPTGSTVVGIAVSKALTSLQTAIPGRECVALWRAVIDGDTYEWAQAFRIVRRMPVWSLTPSELLDAWPVMRTLRPAQDPTLEQTIAAAWKHRVLHWLAAQHIDEEDVISADVLEPLHAVGCVLQLIEGNESINDATAARIQARWTQLSRDILGRKDWYEAPQTNATPLPPSPSQNVARSTAMVR